MGLKEYLEKKGIERFERKYDKEERKREMEKARKEAYNKSYVEAQRKHREQQIEKARREGTRQAYQKEYKGEVFKHQARSFLETAGKAAREAAISGTRGIRPAVRGIVRYARPGRTHRRKAPRGYYPPAPYYAPASYYPRHPARRKKKKRTSNNDIFGFKDVFG